MASPVTVRNPLSTRSVNTPFYSPSTTTTSTTAPTAVNTYTKPIPGQKRTHSQITGGQENSNVQTQLFNSFKSPPIQTRQAQRSRTLISETRVKPSQQTLQPQTTFKQPLPKTIVTDTKGRQRQATHDPSVAPVVEDKEMIRWRKSMKLTLSKSTIYFDGVEETFREQATRWITRLGGVSSALYEADDRMWSNSFRRR
jgi:hypothetical protein